MSNSTPEELAIAASAPGTFSFTERLRNRAYPKDVLTISLNEDLGYKILELEDSLADTTDPKKVKATEAKIAGLREAIKPDIYKLHMTGISPEAYDEMVEDAIALHPYEYEEQANPLTGEKTKVIVADEERDKAFRKLRWLRHIESVEDHLGNVEKATAEMVDEFMKHAPLMAQGAVMNMIEKLGLSVDWMQYIQDEDFSPKP